MLNCDEVILELSREQATSSSGSATWTNNIPNLILEEGDTITCQGGWISVSNSGDNSIEVYDKQNPLNDSVDASFYVSYYKTMDSKNIVAFPYHSQRLTLTDENELGIGFKKQLPIGEYNNLNIAELNSEDYTDYNKEHYNGVPLIQNRENHFVNITEVYTYETLKHEQDADKYDETTSYTDFLTNTSLTQGIRDAVNTGNYYTAMYRKENGGYDLLQRKVDVVIPKGYYSPDNLASFITEQLQTKYFNESVGNNSPETWTNSGRYVVAMTPVATPQINLGLTSGVVDLQSNRTDFLSTNSSPYAFKASDNQLSGIQTAINLSSGTGFTNYYTGVKIINILPPDILPDNTYLPIYAGGVFAFPVANYLTIQYSPTSQSDFNDWKYLQLLANLYSGLSSKFHQQTNGTIYTPETPYDNAFQLGCCFLINTIENTAGQTKNNILWNGSVYNTIGGAYNHPEISADILPIMWEDDGSEYGKFIIRTTILTYNQTAVSDFGGDAGDILPLAFVAPATTSVSFPDGYFYDTSIPFIETYPDGYEIDGGVIMSAGGAVRAFEYAVWTPFRYNFRIPIGVPLYVGLLRQIDIGGGWGYTLVNNSSGYAWSAFEVQTAIDTKYNPTTNTIPTDLPSFTYSITSTSMNYTNGNRYLGMTCANFNRWSLKNNDEPPKVLTEPELEPNVMPILRKYPLFMKTGMETNTTALLKSASNQEGVTGEYYSLEGDAIYPDAIDTEISSLILGDDINQEGRYIFTNNTYNALLPSGYTAIEAWYKFIQGQIQDGLIDIDAGTHTDTDGEVYFYAYSHFCLAEGVETINYEGSDDAIRNRPRGLIIKIHKATFLNTTIKTLYKNNSITGLNTDSPTPYFSRGLLIAGKTLSSLKIGCPTYSWINDKIGAVPSGLTEYNSDEQPSNTTTGNTSYGFLDYNLVGEGVQGGVPPTTIDLTLSLTHLKNTSGVSMGWGYSYKKTGWRNFTAMLCSYALEESDATNFMFDSKANRMDKNANRFNNNNLDATEWGSLSYNPRIYLGADQASLSFDGDGSSRFYWNNFFLTNKIGNKYFEGVENSTGGTLQPSIQQPFYNIYKGFSYGVEGTPNTTTNSTDWSNDLPANTEEGTEIIQYNKYKNSLYNDGMFQLAPELTKHKTLIMGVNSHNAEQGNYVSGTWFNYAYPVDTNLTTRFFCYDADVRYNTFALGEYEYDHSIGNSSNFTNFGKPTNIQAFNWDTFEETYTDGGVLSAEGAKYLTPSRFWGCMSGDEGFIEKTSEAGTSRPNQKVIYDSVAGIQVFNWGNYNRENWTDSFWDTIGFKLTDMMPTPFQYCGQQRNFTTNFMTPSSSTFRTHSYPMRNDADLTDSGFITITENIQGQLQYLLQYPRKNYITALGLQGVNNLEQNSYSFIGMSNGSYSSTGSQAFPFQYSGWTEIKTAGGGATYINGQLIPEEFAILYTQSTKNYASDVADKLQSPFYLVRCNLAEDNFKYANNSVVPAVHTIMGVISKQYGATSDWYYSTDSVNMVFTNRRRRVLNEVKIVITEKSGAVANNIQPKSTIFFKIRRADIYNPDGTIKQNRFDADTENLTAIEGGLKSVPLKPPIDNFKTEYDLYEEEIALLLGKKVS